MELVIPNKHFVCVDYPGEVVNIDKAIETLGGLKHLNTTFKDKNMRLKLNFRYDDTYCKPAYGDCVSRVSLIIKVRRKKTNPSMIYEESPSQIQGEIVGTIDTAYNFTSLCDFQYLAMKKQESGAYDSHFEESLIREVHSREWLSKPAHLFILPPIFSRFDQPVQYCFKENTGYKNFQFPDNCIGMSRNRRPHFTMFFKFNSISVPDQPHEECLKKLQKMALPSWKIENVVKKFEQKKIWSTVALYAEVGPSISREDLKAILPYVAYYCTDGPWRAMWVKLGYDMRSDPSSKIFQNLDTRQEKRMAALNSNQIPAKRRTFNYHLPNTISRNAAQQPASVQQQTSIKHKNDEQNFKKSLESSYIFRPGVRPNHRQIFYHLYNIEEPEVQRLIHMNDGREMVCTEKDGWCLPDTIEKCRSIINSYRYKGNDVSSQNMEEAYDEADMEEGEEDEDDDDEDQEEITTCIQEGEATNANDSDDECDDNDGDYLFDTQQPLHNVLDNENFSNILNLISNEDN